MNVSSQRLCLSVSVENFIINDGQLLRIPKMYRIFQGCEKKYWSSFGWKVGKVVARVSISIFLLNFFTQMLKNSSFHFGGIFSGFRKTTLRLIRKDSHGWDDVNRIHRRIYWCCENNELLVKGRRTGLYWRQLETTWLRIETKSN